MNTNTSSLDRLPRNVSQLLEARSKLISSPPLLNLELTVPDRQGFMLSIPFKSGIYLFHDLRGIIYIGQSVNLRRRFDEHFWEVDNPLLATAIAQPVTEMYFSYFTVNTNQLKKVEADLIRVFQPLCNRLKYHNCN